MTVTFRVKVLKNDSKSCFRGGLGGPGEKKRQKIKDFDFPKDVVFLGHPRSEAGVCSALELKSLHKNWSLLTKHNKTPFLVSPNPPSMHLR